MPPRAANEKRLKTLVKERPLVTGADSIIVFGAGGQIGTKMRPLLEHCYPGRVIYCDHGQRVADGMIDVDIRDADAVRSCITKNKGAVIINLVALMSGVAQARPALAYEINVKSQHQLFQIARELDLKAVMVPSSIAIQEFDERIDDSKMVKRVLGMLKKTASTRIIARAQGAYGLAKEALEVEACMHVGIFEKNAMIPRLAGVLNCHTPWPSDGTTEELDKMIVAAAMQEAYPHDWEQKLRKELEAKDAEQGTSYLAQGQYLRGGNYVPAVPATAKFDMIDSKTLPEALLLLLHQDFRPYETPNGLVGPGPVHNISEYSVSMHDAAQIIRAIHEGRGIKTCIAFATEVGAGLDRGKTESANDWSQSQDTRSTEYAIGKFKQFSAKRSISENYHRVVAGLKN